MDLKMNANESPSMRVRRLIKNESPKKTSTKCDVRQKINDMIANTPQNVNKCFVASNTLTSYNGLSKGNER